MASNDLTRRQAEQRSAQISNVQYTIRLNLDKTETDYKGETTLQFDFNTGGLEELMVDFITKEVSSLTLNGKDFLSYRKDDFWLYIPTSSLKNGENQLAICYTNDYDKTGSGFHRFVDPEDDEVYIHTDFEPYDAHRLFPCFDQPDLKATYQLTVTGPDDWEFIHNSDPAEGKVRMERDARKKIEFKRTALFSTYIFALVVGPHTKWADRYRNIPLRLYCRKSLAKYIDPKNLFAITKESFEFLENYFDIPYPYGKYDQVFVPEFNFGAMENVACVTFTEHYIFRHKRMYRDYLNRSNTFFHEMVHMWFGNLVTMKWWNDLWLNESFADYLSYFAMSKGRLFPDSLEHMFARKEWAYMQDQLSTTHPIVASAEDTAEAFSNFDGISYAKGASVLKQMMFYIGENKFRQGIRIYLKKFYEKNTVLEDFLSCMSQASGVDIVGWSRQWLQTTGVNTLKPRTTENSCIVEQIPSVDNDQIRDHAILYESYALADGKPNISESGKVFVVGAQIEFPLKSKSRFILLNAQDHDYTKVFFSDADLDFISENVTLIEDRFTRRIIWGNLWQMVRDNALSPIRFLEMIEKHSNIEPDQAVLQAQLLAKAISTKSQFLTDPNREMWADRLFQLSIENLEKEKNDQFQMSWFNLMLACTETETSITHLKNILDGGKTYKNLEIDQEKRWNIVTRLCAFNFKDAEGLVQAETTNDPGDLGEKRAFSARASFPDSEVKSNYWNMFTDKKQSSSTDYMRYGMRGFFWHRQKVLLEPYVDKFFADLKTVYETRDMHYSSAFGSALFPMVMDVEQTLKQTKEFLDVNTGLPKLCRKDLIENADHLKRRLPVLRGQD